MKNCVLLTMDELQDLSSYDFLLEKPLAKLGWKSHEISWRDKTVNWSDFDVVIIRSTWDYQENCAAFLDVLDTIDRSDALLLNSLDLVRWNINKHYLRNLESSGVFIVPTLWEKNYSEALLTSAFDRFKSSEIIVKPCLSAGALDTFRITKNTPTTEHDKIVKLFNNREFMMQPFVPSVVTEGEYSLFFFNRIFSHAILKKPKPDEFRVQEEFGGQLLLITPDAELLNTAEDLFNHIPHKALYARLDFVKFDGKYAMMEAELIEPSLYFNMDSYAATKFAVEFNRFYKDY